MADGSTATATTTVTPTVSNVSVTMLPREIAVTTAPVVSTDVTKSEAATRPSQTVAPSPPTPTPVPAPTPAPTPPAASQGFFIYQGTADQQARLRAATDKIKFPWDRLLPGMQANKYQGLVNVDWHLLTDPMRVQLRIIMGGPGFPWLGGAYADNNGEAWCSGFGMAFADGYPITADTSHHRPYPPSAVSQLYSVIGVQRTDSP